MSIVINEAHWGLSRVAPQNLPKDGDLLAVFNPWLAGRKKQRSDYMRFVVIAGTQVQLEVQDSRIYSSSLKVERGK